MSAAPRTTGGQIEAEQSRAEQSRAEQSRDDGMHGMHGMHGMQGSIHPNHGSQ